MDGRAYEVHRWHDAFENNRTRKMQIMRWVPIPNHFDGEGYATLVSGHPNGAAHYGAWVTMVSVASRCHPRGTLVRSNGEPHSPDTLSIVTRLPREVYREAWPRLVEIG